MAFFFLEISLSFERVFTERWYRQEHNSEFQVKTKLLKIQVYRDSRELKLLGLF